MDDVAAAHQRAIGETQAAKERLDSVQATFTEKKEERNERLAALGSRNISPTSSNNSSTVGVHRSGSQRYASGSSLGPGGAAIGRSASASSGGSGHRVAAPAYTGETVQSPVQASPVSPVAGGVAGGAAGAEPVRRVAAPEYGAPSPVGGSGAGSMGLAERAAHDDAAAAQGYPTQQVPQIHEPVPQAQAQGRPVPAVPDTEPRTVKSHPPIIGGSPEGPQSHPPIIGGAQPPQPGAGY